MNEHENIEPTEVDDAELQRLLENPPPPARTLLETWRELLAGIEASRDERITVEVASRILHAWPRLDYQDLSRYHARYHEHLLELREILHQEIKGDPDCLSRVENDAVENRAHYINLLFCWQVADLRWESEWSPDHPDAAVELAAISDAIGFYFGKKLPNGMGQQGLVDHLGSIGFEFTEADRDEMGARLAEMKAVL